MRIVVAEASDGAEAVAAVREHQPDVVLLDIRMPNLDGIEAAKIICANTGCKVLMLTTFDLDDYVHQALRAGASVSRRTGRETARRAHRAGTGNPGADLKAADARRPR